jgi:hypothetical protein
VAFLPPARISRFVRLAALLPVVLLGGMLAAWLLWILIDSRLPFLRYNAPLVLRVPIAAALAGMLAATCAAALAVRRRRAVPWPRALVTVALTELLLLGLWVPIASWWWGYRRDVAWSWDDGIVLSLGPAAGLIAIAVGPPLALATAFSALASRRPELVRRTAGLWGAALLLLFAGSVAARLGASYEGYLVYVNLVHFLAAAVFVAAAALVAFVAGLWLRGRRARRRLAEDRAPLVGVISGDADDPRGIVACLELEGWLRGPRALVDAFEVSTGVGSVLVPIGAELAAQLPETSTVLEVGESVAVLRRGDRVVVGGLVEPPSDHPFRGTAALVPGPGGVVVRRHDDAGEDLASVALVAWRPCVALLIILTAVAIPALAAALVLS